MTRERAISGDGVGYVVVMGVWLIEMIVFVVHSLVILACMGVILFAQQRPVTVVGFLVATLLTLLPAVLFGYVLLLTGK